MIYFIDNVYSLVFINFNEIYYYIIFKHFITIERLE